MERSQIDAEHVVARYLAGELTADDEAGFEEYAAHNPDIYREVENLLRMKEGLATLHDKGTLQQILRERRRWPSAGVAAAAALVALAVGIWIWRNVPLSSVAILARSPAQFVDAKGRPIGVSSRYVLIRSREQTPLVELQLPRTPGAIELRILPSVFVPLGRYRAGLARIESGHSGGVIHEISGLQAGEDRYVTLYLDAARLAPGDYEISLVPDGSGQPDAETDRFAVRVR